MATTNSSQNFTGMEPYSWFDHPIEISTIIPNNWPWKQFTIEQYKYCLDRLDSITPFWKLIKQIDVFDMWVGIIGSLLTMVTILGAKKSVKNLTVFYYVMLFESFLDLSFVGLKFIRWALKNFAQPSQFITDFNNYAGGVAYSCSMLSDTMTLALTFERYMAFAFPVFYNSRSHAQKKWAWFVMISVAIFMSSSRMHYSFDSYTENNAFLYAVSFFSDALVPFAYTALMLFFVLSLSVFIFKRHQHRKSQVADQAQANDAVQQNDRKMMKTISLLAVMMFMFLINQFAYIAYAVIVQVRAKYRFDYSSPFDDINAYVTILLIFEYIDYISVWIEIISRSAVFYAYICLNASFRADFKSLFKCNGGNGQTNQNPVQNQKQQRSFPSKDPSTGNRNTAGTMESVVRHN